MAKIGVISAGAWGSALAITAVRAGNEVQIWARESEVVAEINTHHKNPMLTGFELPESVRATTQLEEVLEFAEVVLLVAPAQYTRDTLLKMKPYWKKDVPLVLCAKGIELSTGQLLTEIAAEVLPEAIVAVLSGPGFAGEVAKGNPTAVTIACEREEVAESLVKIMGSNCFRPYFCADTVSPVLCGAIKNVIAIAAGIVDGCGFGDNGRAALITRGLNEMVRFAKALGGHRTTVMGLSGVGDLILTACSAQSRNYSFGYQVGITRSAKKALADSHATVEGVATARAVMKRARALDVDMPICQAVEEILYNGLSVDDILKDLLSRPFKSEVDAF